MTSWKRALQREVLTFSIKVRGNKYWHVVSDYCSVEDSYLFRRRWIYPHSIVSPKYSNHQITRLVFLGRSWVTEQKPVRLCLIEIPGKSLAWHLAEVRLEDEALWCTSTASISPDRQKVFPTSTTQGSKEQQQSVNAANVLLAMNMRSWVNEKLCALFLYHQMCHWIRIIFNCNWPLKPLYIMQ